MGGQTAQTERQIVIELDPASEPIAGRLSRPDGLTRPFRGWLELTSLIEAARAGVGSEPSPAEPERRR